MRTLEIKDLFLIKYELDLPKPEEVKESLKERLIPRKLTTEPEEELKINEEERDFSFYTFA